jgi:hypothetical protein
MEHAVFLATQYKEQYPHRDETHPKGRLALRLEGALRQWSNWDGAPPAFLERVASMLFTSHPHRSTNNQQESFPLSFISLLKNMLWMPRRLPTF